MESTFDSMRSAYKPWYEVLKKEFIDEKIGIYVARNLKSSKQNLDEDEFVDVKAYTMEELKEKIYAGEIQDSKTIAALLAYEVKYLRS